MASHFIEQPAILVSARTEALRLSIAAVCLCSVESFNDCGRPYRQHGPKT